MNETATAILRFMDPLLWIMLLSNILTTKMFTTQGSQLQLHNHFKNIFNKPKFSAIVEFQLYKT